jgi:two-component system NarL family sensor kinase
MENDRKSLAQELHDSIGGTLTAIMYQLEGRLSRMDQAPVSSEMPLERILDHLRDAVHQTRRISKRLRPSILDDFGLVAAVRDTVNDFREFFPEKDVSLELDIPEESIPNEMNIVLYRVVQEALNNIGKHSRATHVTIRLTVESSECRLAIHDNGCGFDMQTIAVRKDYLHGYGISSMKERVEICKGVFRIHSEIGKGTSITASLPLNPDRL